MKKIFLILFLTLCLLPINVLAKGKINVYLFTTENCPYCENALEHFNNIDDEYSNYFDLIVKSTSDRQTIKIVDDLEEYLDIEITGYPFILIGDNYLIGYSSSLDDKIKKIIVKNYLNEDMEYIDIIQEKLGYNINGDDKTKLEFLPILIVLTLVIGIIIFKNRDQIKNLIKFKKFEKKYILIGIGVAGAIIASSIVIIIINANKTNYYCYEGHTLSDKMCFYKDSYKAQVSCPTGFYVTHANDCAKKGNGAILPNVRKTYSCPKGGSLSEDTCIVQHSYNAFTEDPNQ